MLAVYLLIKQRDRERIKQRLTVARLAAHGDKADIDKFLKALE